MLPQHVLLVILIMAGSLCSVLWGMHPEEQLRESQQERVHRVTTVIFH